MAGADATRPSCMPTSTETARLWRRGCPGATRPRCWRGRWPTAGRDRFPDCRAMVAALATAMGQTSSEESRRASGAAAADAMVPVAVRRAAAEREGPPAGGPAAGGPRGRGAGPLTPPSLVRRSGSAPCWGPRCCSVRSGRVPPWHRRPRHPSAPPAYPRPRQGQPIPGAAGCRGRPAIPAASGSPAPARQPVPRAIAGALRRSDRVLGRHGRELDIWAVQPVKRPAPADERPGHRALARGRVPGGEAVIYTAGEVGSATCGGCRSTAASHDG